MIYQVRHAEMSDLPRIEALYAQARAFMAAAGNPGQWGSHHPPRALLEEDIHKKNLYLLTEEETIHAVFALVPGEDPTYGEIFEGAWHQDRPYAAIHRVAGDGSGGVLNAAVAFASQTYDYLRIDTHKDNAPMQRSIAKAGFQYCGIILTHDGTPRLAYDRIK